MSYVADSHDRACDAPGCAASYDAATGPTPGQRWLMYPTFGMHLCPDHTWLWHSHRPGLDHTTRTAACACGLALPGPTLGDMERAWLSHARALLGMETEQEAGR